MPLINCEVNLLLTWSKDCVMTDMTKREVTPKQVGNAAVLDSTITNTTFAIANTKLYVPVVTLSSQDDNKLLQQLNTGFK